MKNSLLLITYFVFLAGPTFAVESAYSPMPGAGSFRDRVDSVDTPTIFPVSVAPESQTDTPRLPRTFMVVERNFMERIQKGNWTMTFDVKDGEGTVLGTLNAKMFAWGRTFHYTDAAGRCIADAKAKVFSWGSEVHVIECRGQEIGAFKENVWESLMNFYTNYSIFDASGKQVATSEKRQWLSTDISINDSFGEQVAQMDRPWINWLADKWTIHLSNSSAVDPRIIVMITAYKTAADHARSHSSSSPHL